MKFLSDFCHETFTGEVPFQMIPENILWSLICQQHKRLSRPTTEDATERGLTNEMWELLWKCSDPIPARRPQFLNITETTINLVHQWRPPSRIEETPAEFGVLPHE